MKAIDLIRWALQASDEGVNALVQDMREAPLTRPIVGSGHPSGNHPLWNLGHMAYIEGNITSCITGDANPFEHWAHLFAPGTQPSDDAGLYPGFDEVLAKLRSLRASNLKLLDAIGEDGLDRTPRRIPPGFETAMQTIGRAFLLMPLHQMVHYGQITVARRAAGRPPLF